MKRIYQYQNYRDYLKDWYREKKKNVPGFTYEKWSQQAAFPSLNYLYLIVNGSRNLTVEGIFHVGQSLGLSGEEQRYFENLVFYTQAKGFKVKQHYHSRLQEFARGIRGVSVIQEGPSPELQDPLLLAIMVGLHGRTKRQGLKFIAEQLKKDEVETERAIQILLAMDVLRTDPAGCYHCKFDHTLFRDRNSVKLSHKLFLKNQIVLSQKALDKTYEKGGRFFSHSFTLSEKEFNRFADTLRTRAEELLNDADELAPVSLVQLNIQFFKWKDC